MKTDHFYIKETCGRKHHLNKLVDKKDLLF